MRIYISTYSYYIPASDVGGYFVSGSAYFTANVARKHLIRDEKSCCYHMTRKEWKKMEEVHEALMRQPEPIDATP